MDKKKLIIFIAIVVLGAGGFLLYQNFLGPGASKEEQGMTPLGETAEEKIAPATNTNLPLPTLPAGIPKGKWVTKNLGNIEIRYFSTAIVWGMSESGTDAFIILKNKGASEAVVNFTPVEDLLGQVPKWNLHFFALQKPPSSLAPGAEKKLWYFASIDEGKGSFTVKFKLWLGSDSANSVEVPIVFGATEGNFYGKETSSIYGYVKDKNGNPLSGVSIDAQMNCGRIGFRNTSDSRGRYTINVLGKEDINAIYQGKELGCDSTDYFLSAEKDGYEYYFKGHVSPTRKNPASADIVLEKQTEKVSYSLKWAKQVAEPYGFFWVKPSSDWSLFAASQAKHDPQLGKPTNFYLFNSSGNIVWKQPTGNECWGIDIAPDGSKVVAGCHDGKVYSVSREGNLLWASDMVSMVRSACISRNGKVALSGTVGNLSLFNTTTGAKSDISWPGGWLRNCMFYLDDSGFIAGSAEIGGFDISGSQKWQQQIGEFPLFLGVDKSKNVFAAGKSRTLFSFDISGRLRWKKKIPDHVVTAGAATPDGKRIALGTIGGMVYLFDGSGNILWKRNLGSEKPGDSTGHNAVAISQDGKRIVVGSAPGNCLLLYNEKGTLLWKKCIDVGKIQKDLITGVTNVQISPDKTKIVASYGDNYIREFIK
ncbi:MAG: PQQ-binding-like beta-propeller repeat protein [Candidatus Doudnabacteria bacterium]